MQYEDKDFDLAQLKKKAAQIVGERQKEKFENKASDMARLVHELEIYQEEVELQNQELRQTAKNLENARNEWFALFAIRERLELLGGNLTIACAPDEGVTATIALPVEPPVYVKPEEPSLFTEEFEKVTQPSSKPVSAGGKIRVMLVDDHAVMRQGLLSFLSGHDDIEIAAEAADGEAAVEQARQIQPDVILMDINMPKMNGVEACRRIQSEMPGIRIYGLSMYEAEDQAQAMTEAGAAGYLSKSGSSDSLLAAIREK